MREFYERARFPVAATASAEWLVPGDRVWRSFPCGRTVAPGDDEIDELRRRPGIAAVEWFNDAGVGVETGIWVVRDPAYDEHRVRRTYRQRLHRALESETVEQIEFADLHRLGRRANEETLARQRKRNPHLTDPVLWRALCEAGRATPGAGALATLGPEGLTAYLLFFVLDGVAHGLISKSLDVARERGSNHLLYFTYARTLVRREGIRAVSIGARAVPPLEGVDRMKRHAGYELERSHLAVVLAPLAGALLGNRLAPLVLRAGQRVLGPGDPLDRAEALRAAAAATEATRPHAGRAKTALPAA